MYPITTNQIDTMYSLDAASKEYIMKNHALVMFIAWMVFFPISIIIARTGTRWKLWLPFHIGFNVVAIMLILYATGVGVSKSSEKHLHGTHRKLGVATLFFLLAQLILGITIARLFSPNKTGPTKLEKLHWWLGRLTIILAFITILVGLVWTRQEVWMLISSLVLQLFYIMLYCFLLIFLM